MAQSPKELAEKNLERLVNNRVFPHGGPGHSQFLNAKVEIGVGLRADEYDSAGNDKEILRVTVTDSHSATRPAAVRDQLLKTLAEVPGLKDHVVFEKDEEHAAKLKAKLEGFIAKGADIPKEYLSWQGFNNQIEEESFHLQDHALNINKEEGQILVVVNLPKLKGEDSQAKTSSQTVKENIEARLPDIKKLLAERVIKYTPSATDDMKKDIRAKVDALKIVTSASEYEYGANLQIRLQSPEQETATKDLKPGDPVPNGTAIAATNPLNGLSKDQLGKALGRSFLHSGESAHAIFPLVAGREDMKRAIHKSLVRLKNSQPDVAKDVDAFLNDDQFKEHDWSKRKNLKQHPIPKKDPEKPGITIDFSLPKDKADEIIKQIAALEGHEAAPQQPQQPQQPLEFARVDSVQLVGGNVTAQQAKTIQELLKTIISVPAQAAPAKEDALIPAAQHILGEVEAGYAHLNMAHQLIHESIKAASPLSLVSTPRISPSQPQLTQGL